MIFTSSTTPRYCFKLWVQELPTGETTYRVCRKSEWHQGKCGDV